MEKILKYSSGQILLTIDFVGRYYTIRELSRKANISNPTVINSVRYMVTAGLVTKSEKGISITESGILARSILLRLNNLLNDNDTFPEIGLWLPQTFGQDCRIITIPEDYDYRVDYYAED